MKKKKTKPRRKPVRTPAAHYPRGWDQNRVNAIAKYYENQTDEEAIAEDEAAWNDSKTTMMQIPVELVPAVRKLLAKRAG
jgi:hypothetical protein